jgi:hypothetical protein
MTDAQGAKKRISTYLVLVFALSSIFWVIIIRAGTLEAGARLDTLALMWMPAVAAIIITLIYQRNIRGLGSGPLHVVCARCGHTAYNLFRPLTKPFSGESS